MLLQTNSYIVPKERRAEHARLMRRFRQILNSLGCDNFEIYEQVGANWSSGQATGRCVQIMRFRDRKHQLAVQNAERSDPAAQKLIAEFCDLINYPYQQQQGQFAVGFYSSVIPVAPARGQEEAGAEETPTVGDEVAVDENPAVEEEAPAAPDAQETAQAEHYIEDINEANGEPADFSSEAPAAAPSNGEAPQPPPLSLVSSENTGDRANEVEGEILSDDLFPNEDAASAAEGEAADAAPAAEVAGETEEVVGHNAELEVEPESRAAAGEPHDDRDLAELDAEMGIEDDEISRMAKELAADDKFDPQHPQQPHAGPENGSHQAH
jgi:hypothetical protein